MKHTVLFIAIFIFIFISAINLSGQSNNADATAWIPLDQNGASEKRSIINIKLSEFTTFSLDEHVKCCDSNIKCPITGFHMVDGNIQTYNGGPRLSSISRYLIAKAEPGQVLIMENIKVKCPSSDDIEYIDDVVFKIVN